MTARLYVNNESERVSEHGTDDTLKLVKENDFSGSWLRLQNLRIACFSLKK